MNKNRFILFFTLLFLTNILIMAAVALMYRVPEYLSSIGASKTYIGIFMSLNRWVAVFFILFFKNYLAMFYRRTLLIIAALFYLLAYLGMFYTQSLVLLMVLNIMQGFGFAIGNGLLLTFLLENIQAGDSRMKWISWLGMGGSIGTGTSSYFVDLWMRHFSQSPLVNQDVFLLGVLIAILWVLIIFTIPKSFDFKEKISKEDQRQQKKEFHFPQYSSLMYLSLILGFYFSLLTSFLGDYSTSLNRGYLVSYFFLFYTGSLTGLRLFFVHFLDKMQLNQRMLVGLGAIHLTLVLLLFYPFLSGKGIIICMGIAYGIGHGILYPTISAAVADVSPKHLISVATLIFLLFFFIGHLSGATLGGIIADLVGYHYMFVIVFSVMTLWILSILWSKPYRLMLEKYHRVHQQNAQETE